MRKLQIHVEKRSAMKFLTALSCVMSLSVLPLVFAQQPESQQDSSGIPTSRPSAASNIPTCTLLIISNAPQHLAILDSSNQYVDDVRRITMTFNISQSKPLLITESWNGWYEPLDQDKIRKVEYILNGVVTISEQQFLSKLNSRALRHASYTTPSMLVLGNHENREVELQESNPSLTETEGELVSEDDIPRDTETPKTILDVVEETPAKSNDRTANKDK